MVKFPPSYLPQRFLKTIVEAETVVEVQAFHDGFWKLCFAPCFCLTFHDRFFKTIVEAPSWNPHSVAAEKRKILGSYENSCACEECAAASENLAPGSRVVTEANDFLLTDVRGLHERSGQILLAERLYDRDGAHD
ncbi:hypothetical protein TIFTF001_020420 [Ficus carica]|uniref:Uncharacterized protein n=1 Tax=Ficus carica TaxID=3494 RepID=A0AA88DB18_FICCA|nr:hypothetical protein TIFTF001_020420 [Ficus carica]